MGITEYEISLRLFLACVFGGIVGYQRERHGSPAGFRTHILVSLGASLIMVLSMYGFSDLVSFNKDPARLAAQVVSGIGFLGAGTILRDKNSIKGLTTAASLWVVSAIGLAVGAGFYFSSFVTTFLVFITLERSVELYFFRNSQSIKVITVNGTCNIKRINRVFELHKIASQNVSMTLLNEEQNRTAIEYKIKTPFCQIDMIKIIEDINEIDGVYSTEEEENSRRKSSSSFCSRLNGSSRKEPKKPSM